VQLHRDPQPPRQRITLRRRAIRQQDRQPAGRVGSDGVATALHHYNGSGSVRIGRLDA